MSEDNRSINPTPQFGTAEYATEPGVDRCKSCNQTVTGNYYRINGVIVCPSCLEQVKEQLPKDTHQAYVTALLFGVGGGVLGLIGYAAFGIITGLAIGYVSLAVGYIVGKAMTMGSKGVGGRRYQITAALLTYAAVSLAAVPIDIAQIRKEHKPSRVEQSQPSSPGEATSDQGTPATQQEPSTSDRPMSFGRALGGLALIGLASPFLDLNDPVHGLIGLVILFVGIRIAWQLTGGPRVQILGPFRQTHAPRRPDAG